MSEIEELIILARMLQTNSGDTLKGVVVRMAEILDMYYSGECSLKPLSKDEVATMAAGLMMTAFGLGNHKNTANAIRTLCNLPHKIDVSQLN